LDLTAAQTLVYLYSNIDVFMAVFVRVMGFFIILPVTSGQNLPIQARLVLSLGIALLAFVANVVQLPPYDLSITGFAILLMSEFLVGIIIGLVVMVLFSIFHFVGQLVDFQIGFGMVNVMDPFGMQQTPITGNLYFLIVSVFFMTSGAIHLVIQAFFDSFGIIGLGQAVVLGNEHLAGQMLSIMVNYFHLGLRMALPVVGTILTVDIVLGILVKAVPNMNVFVVGLPIKVMAGLVVIYFIMPFLIGAFDMVMVDVVANIVEMMWRMVPVETN